MHSDGLPDTFTLAIFVPALSTLRSAGPWWRSRGAAARHPPGFRVVVDQQGFDVTCYQQGTEDRRVMRRLSDKRTKEQGLTIERGGSKGLLGLAVAAKRSFERHRLGVDA
jgi:hypothetical protein